MKIASLIVGAGVAGAFCTIAVGTLLELWEARNPLKQSLDDNQRDKFTAYFRRVITCVWSVTALLYIVLTYWW